MRNQKVCYNYLRSVLILLVVMTFGFFNASGHIISTFHVSPAQIEQTNYQSNTHDNSRLDISKIFQSAQATDANPILKWHFCFNSTYMVCHNALISVKYQSLKKKALQFTPFIHIIKLVGISRNSQDPFNL